MTRETFDILDCETQNDFIMDFIIDNPGFDEDSITESDEFAKYKGFDSE